MAGIWDPQHRLPWSQKGTWSLPCSGSGKEGVKAVYISRLLCDDEFSHERSLTYTMIQVEFCLNARTQILLSRTEQG